MCFVPDKCRFCSQNVTDFQIKFFLAEEDKKINKTELLSALKNLNSVWHYLYQAEQKKIVDMLVNNVIVKEDGLKINLNLDGFDPLLTQLAN